jgi:hypothetical protein
MIIWVLGMIWSGSYHDISSGRNPLTMRRNAMMCYISEFYFFADFLKLVADIVLNFVNGKPVI